MHVAFGFFRVGGEAFICIESEIAPRTVGDVLVGNVGTREKGDSPAGQGLQKLVIQHFLGQRGE